MSSRFLTFAAATLLAASPAFCADNSNQSAKPNTPGESQSHEAVPAAKSQTNEQSAAQQCPEGFVLLEENVVYEMADQPQQHLLRAHEQMARNNPKAAAAELRMAARYIKMQEARHGESGKQLLAPWSQRLDELAQRVGNGDVKSRKDIVKDSADTSYALAKWFNERAINELKSGKEVQAGYDLSAAAGNFEQALSWAQQKPQQEDQTCIADAQRSADKLITAENLENNKAGENGKAVENNKSGENGKAAENAKPGEAQPAAAKEGPQNQQGEHRASKAADALLKRIDGASNQFSPAPEKDQSPGASASNAGNAHK